MIALGFAGKTVGNVFEGEKRFDMVIQLNQTNRQGINDLKNLYVATLMENKFHYKELTTMITQKGQQRSRGEQYRRIVVGVNVRNRDLQESVVTDVQHR
jgi:cobalt-zinc-cadmium resistance protein CzcA